MAFILSIPHCRVISYLPGHVSAIDSQENVTDTDSSTSISQTGLFDTLHKDVARVGALVQADANDVIDITSDLDQDVAVINPLVLGHVILDGEDSLSILLVQ